MKKIFSLISLFIISTTALFAQTGELQGRIINANSKTKEGVEFATVVLLRNGTQVTGTVADIDGNYIIKPIQPGIYDLAVSCLNYTPTTVSGIQVSADKITPLDVTLGSGGVTLVEQIVYEKKLIDPDKTSTGGTMSKKEIQESAISRSNPNNIAAKTAGVYQSDAGAGLNVNGGRGYAQKYYVDGIPMRGSISLPSSSIEQLTIITGGIPARYGDATGGIINITTRGPSKYYHGGLELGNSYLLDAYGYKLASLNLSGPLFTKYKSSKGTKQDSSDAKLGFFLSAEYEGNLDGDPSAVGNWKAKDSVLAYLQENPLRPSAIGQGFVTNASFITKNDLEEIKAMQNANDNNYRMSLKIDYKLNKFINITFGGNANYSQFLSNGFTNQIFTPETAPFYQDLTYRGFVRFTQRFGSTKNTADGKTESEKTASVFQNAYYSIQVDYSKFLRKFEDKDKGFDAFKYGHIGNFKTYRTPVYFPSQDTVWENGVPKIYSGLVLAGYRDTLVTFTPGSENSLMGNYTKQYYQLAGSDPINGVYGLQDASPDNQFLYYSSLSDISSGGGLLNGDGPSSVYSMWGNTGSPIGTFGRTNNDQYRLAFYSSVDIVRPSKVKGEKNRHAIEFGIEYEQRADRAYTVAPIGLWGLARQLTNKHILNLDTRNPILVYDEFGIFQDTINYNRLVGNDQAYFDLNLRSKLGLDPRGTDYINIDELDPSTLSLDMFSPDELFNNGSAYVSYYGFDYLGNVLKKQPSFDDFFKKNPEDDFYPRKIGAYRPTYVAGYIQDKFNFKDLIFNIGLRVDYYDANQKVLKDPYLLYPARTASEVTEINGAEITHPSSIGTDYVVYVDNPTDPKEIVGYRNGNTWYNADGTEVSNPQVIALATSTGKIAPYLTSSNTDSLIVTPDAFKDYDPQYTLMPRIAFSFPISDVALFFAHYDVLSQRPTANRGNPFNYYFLQSIAVNSTLQNPNLKPEKTIDYQVGFEQALGKNSSLSISGIYREFKNQVQIKKYFYSFPTNYTTYGNEDFGTAKSFLVSYEMRRTNNIRMEVNYTLQFADGTGSDQSSSGGLINETNPSLKTITPLNYDQRHTISTTFDYRYGEGDKYNGPLVGKNNTPILANTGLDVIFTGGSGTPYTRQSNATPAGLSGVATQSTLKGTLNGARLPWTFRIDLKIDKDFRIGKAGNDNNPFYINGYILIENALNTKNVLSVYPYTGNPDDDGYLSSAVGQQSLETQLNKEAFLDQYSIRINNPGNYTLPRRIRCGLSFDF